MLIFVIELGVNVCWCSFRSVQNVHKSESAISRYGTVSAEMQRRPSMGCSKALASYTGWSLTSLSSSGLVGGGSGLLARCTGGPGPLDETAQSIFLEADICREPPASFVFCSACFRNTSMHAQRCPNRICWPDVQM